MIHMGPDRRFEAIVVDWHRATESGNGTDPGAFRAHVEAASDAGLHLALVVSGDAVATDDRLGALGDLGARPPGPGRLQLVPDRDSASSWLRTLGVGPGTVLFLDGELDRRGLDQLLADQVERRRRGEVPHADDTPGWTLTVDTIEPEHERASVALLTIADGYIGNTGSPTIAHAASEPRVMTANVYDEAGSATHLLYGPVWYAIEDDPNAARALRRVLDLRTGLLHETGRAAGPGPGRCRGGAI